MRKNIVVANWKMNLVRSDALILVHEVLSNKADNISVNVVFAPSYPYIYKVAKLCEINDNFSVSAQDCSSRKQGAHTGEVSAEMIASCGAEYVILGHSERRIKFNESNEQIKHKIDNALENNLKVIFCCGESLQQRDSELHFDWVEEQIKESIFHLSKDQVKCVTLAYEPIWAIGTGKTASTVQAQDMHHFIRNLFEKKYDNDVSDNLSILYGGSCNPNNASQLFSQNDIDGGLIGGASLHSDKFLAIINSF